MTNLTVVIPTKNEEESLQILLGELEEFKNIIGEIIVIDANSTDKTIEVAKQFKCRTIIQKEKTGYGDAIIKGINKSNFEYSVILDGDGSKNPSYIKILFDKILEKNSDFVFAERYGNDASSLDDTILTYIGNRIFTNLGKFFFDIKINDILHTFFVCKNSSFRKINFEHFNFGFCVELPVKIEKLKLNYFGIPTVERKRLAGEVKVRSFVDGFKILYSMINLYFANFSKNI